MSETLENEPNEPIILDEDSNTDKSSSKKKKTNNQLYKWDFTLNNYTELEVSQVKHFITNLCKKGVFGFEVGEKNGTPHLQGYFSLIKKLRKSAIINHEGFKRASLRPCRNEIALINYCKKDGEFWSFGFPKPLKTLLSLKPWQMEIEKIYMTEPDDRKIYWFYEEIGGVGKSSFIKYMIIKYNILFCSGGKHSDIMNLVFNQNMDETKCVMFDIPRANKGHISYASLECIKNGMVCNTKYETGVKVFNSPHVFIFANFPPDQPDLLSPDRWNIYKIGEEPFV